MACTFADLSTILHCILFKHLSLLILNSWINTVHHLLNLQLQSLVFQELLMVMAAALGCGLLIGLERERSKQRENQQSFAGIRSFVLCTLLGALCFSFGAIFGAIGALIIGGITIFSVKNQTQDLGVTTEVAFVMSYFIGALCLWNITLAASLSVMLTIILMMKHSIHGIAAQWITEAEFKDGLFLLALILIGLPLTPNTPLWGSVLNPYLILKLLALILAVQALAHITKRLLSSKNALILSAIASDFVSSTATIASLGMEVRADRADAHCNAGAALMSCISTLVLLLIIAAGISLSWLKILLLPCLAAILILVLCGLWLLRKSSPKENLDLTDSRMFSLKEAALIAGTLTLIQAGVYGLNILLGDAGLIIGTLLASLFEIHAAAAAVFVQGDPNHPTLLYAMMLGLGAHALSKCINAILSGGWTFARVFIPVQILHMLVCVSLFFWLSHG